MLQIAYARYPDQESRDELRDGLLSTDREEKMEWIDKGILDALLYLTDNSKICFRLFSQTFMPDEPFGWLLSFCSSKPLPDDLNKEFLVDNVKPHLNLDALLDFAEMLAMYGERPEWYIPDNAMDFKMIAACPE